MGCPGLTNTFSLVLNLLQVINRWLTGRITALDRWPARDLCTASYLDVVTYRKGSRGPNDHDRIISGGNRMNGLIRMDVKPKREQTRPLIL